MTDTTLPTNNEAWGFFGSIRHYADSAKAWPLAMQAVGAATGSPDWAVREFLDSRDGRHFADDVATGIFQGLDLRAAIDTAADRWMGWTISRRTEREHGIPRGLPYLTGFVIHYGILAEMAD